MKTYLFVALMVLASSVSAQTFTETSTIPGTVPTVSSTSPASIVAEPLRGNGVTDLVFVQGDNICVLLGNNDGTFQPTNCFPSGLSPLHGIAVADLDQDGHLDIVAAAPIPNAGLTGVKIFYGDGTGKFPNSTSFPGVCDPVFDSVCGELLSGPFVSSFHNNGALSVAVSIDENCQTTASKIVLNIINPPVVSAPAVESTDVYTVNTPIGECGQFVAIYNSGLLSDGATGLATPTNDSPEIWSIANGPQSFQVCGHGPEDGARAISSGTSIIGFLGDTICVQRPPDPTILAQYTFPSLNYNPSAVVPIRIGSVFQGFIALPNASVGTTPLQFFYGSDLLHLSQSGTIATDNQSPDTGAAGVAGIFTTSGLQDFAILGRNGVTIFLQQPSAPVPPTITTQPSNATVALGSTAAFNITAQGSQPLSYQWFKDGSPVGINSPSYVTAPTISGDTNSIINVTVTNSAGTVTSNNVTLTVEFPAVIQLQPVSVSVQVGASATFTVQASGTGLQYQWQRGGTNISGATSASYTTPAVTITDNNSNFDVIVSAVVGPAVQSSVVVLTVTTPPPPPSFTVTLNPASATVTAGQSANSQVTITPSGGFSGTVLYQCAVPGDKLSCTVSSSGAVTVISTATTTSVSKYHFPELPWGIWIVVSAFIIIPRRRLAFASLALCFALGCTTGKSSTAVQTTTVTVPGTPMGSYEITVTGVSGTVTSSAIFTLTVN